MRIYTSQEDLVLQCISGSLIFFSQINSTEQLLCCRRFLALQKNSRALQIHMSWEGLLTSWWETEKGEKETAQSTAWSRGLGQGTAKVVERGGNDNLMESIWICCSRYLWQLNQVRHRKQGSSFWGSIPGFSFSFAPAQQRTCGLGGILRSLLAPFKSWLFPWASCCLPGLPQPLSQLQTALPAREKDIPVSLLARDYESVEPSVHWLSYRRICTDHLRRLQAIVSRFI